MLSGELMPTTVRAAGVGSSSLVSKVGGTLSTTVAALADIHPAIPTSKFHILGWIEHFKLSYEQHTVVQKAIRRLGFVLFG